MFAYPQAYNRGRKGMAMLVSTAAHVVVLAILSMRPEAILVQPTLRAEGDRGSSVVLYFAPQAAQQSLVAQPAKPRPARLYLPRPVKRQYNSVFTDQPGAQAHNTEPQVSTALPGTSAGTDPVGSDSGPDVRPAVEVTLVDPPVLRSDIPAGVDGDVVVEVSIDEQGNVTGTKLLKGLAHGVDEKVMATILKWHYVPATRNGIPIPSKYDAHFRYHG